MPIGLVGRKVGMTRIFTDEGGTQPVTVLDVSDNRVTQIKSAEKDGYAAVQVAFGKRRASRVNKAIAGQLAKAGVEAGHTLREFRARAEELANLQVGAKVGVEIFKVGQKVDVQGVTIGKGFAGVIKRYHFGGQNASHGNSVSHRVPGSTGQNQSPGRVFPGKRMPGHLGNARRTISNLEVVRVDAERQLLLVKGSVPGSNGGDVIVRPAVKIAKPTVKQQPKAQRSGAGLHRPDPVSRARLPGQAHARASGQRAPHDFQSRGGARRRRAAAAAREGLGARLERRRRDRPSRGEDRQADGEAAAQGPEIGCRAPPARPSLPGASSRASACPGIWATRAARFPISRWCASTPSGSCCS